MLQDTLVFWGSEFGRTPMNEARGGTTVLAEQVIARVLLHRFG